MMMTVALIVAVFVMMMTVVVVLRTVAGLVFGGLHEVHRSLTGMVFVAVLVPVPGVSRRYVQIDRLDRRCTDNNRGRLRDYRLRVHHRRRRSVADRDLTIHTRNHLAADDGVEADILGLRQRRGGREQCR